MNDKIFFGNIYSMRIASVRESYENVVVIVYWDIKYCFVEVFYGKGDYNYVLNKNNSNYYYVVWF